MKALLTQGAEVMPCRTALLHDGLNRGGGGGACFAACYTPWVLLIVPGSGCSVYAL